MTANEPDSNSTVASGADRSRDIAGAKTITLVVYALQAASFLVGVTWIAAVIINYIKKEDVAGTWLESHFRWQIRTFWYGLLYSVIGVITIVFGIGWAILMADLVWVIYRIVKGWLRLSEGKRMYVSA
jgi:uncharacterized membrane protein